MLTDSSLANSASQGIYYKEATREFHLVGKSSLYAFYVGAGNGLVHLHWGHLDPAFVASVRGWARRLAEMACWA